MSCQDRSLCMRDHVQYQSLHLSGASEGQFISSNQIINQFNQFLKNS